jgi:hypothetical protein
MKEGDDRRDAIGEAFVNQIGVKLEAFLGDWTACFAERDDPRPRDGERDGVDAHRLDPCDVLLI